ncbi:enoyl-CoA hydratase/isomerase family protein [Duganella sp. FT92W]|uniref:3-hydroxyisobutyryl-CoA hydrolase n=1 Tax=Pseudoduganella rivuli TaxID=2666085 RepID=A0A7X2LSL4_9BURK|nr:enoyl-CoA hydratase/isomerase family protein [Pseudoduganella rivuli]MRV72048.1 enoyl-CoA hydratase/isomerase family protein [Pseudoduganella rivuli]
MDGSNTVPATGLPVLAETLQTANGRLIGVLTLNAEKTLNAVSLPMIELLTDHLAAWAEDDDVAMVLLQGAGSKAFCAGGDLHNLYRTMHAQRESDQAGDVTGNAYANAFFSMEYRLDYTIHTYEKPILCWGHGIVMGGGIGLMAGASHRVATERTRMAMPEAGIGLFPDVGGSWFLNRMPGHAGRFLALTGISIEAADARYVGLADYVLPHAVRDDVVEALLIQPWSANCEANHALVGYVLRRAEARSGDQAWTHTGPLRQHQDLIDYLCGRDSVDDVLSAMAALETNNPWLDKAAASPRRASPGALRLAWRMLEAAKHLSLADVFRLEYGVALHCAARGDFAEGIRALLIDKDMAPDWLPADSSAGFLDNPWAGHSHPLADLK